LTLSLAATFSGTSTGHHYCQERGFCNPARRGAPTERQDLPQRKSLAHLRPGQPVWAELPSLREIFRWTFRSRPSATLFLSGLRISQTSSRPADRGGAGCRAIRGRRFSTVWGQHSVNSSRLSPPSGRPNRRHAATPELARVLMKGVLATRWRFTPSSS